MSGILSGSPIDHYANMAIYHLQAIIKVDKFGEFTTAQMAREDFWAGKINPNYATHQKMISRIAEKEKIRW